MNMYFGSIVPSSTFANSPPIATVLAVVTEPATDPADPVDPESVNAAAFACSFLSFFLKVLSPAVVAACLACKANHCLRSAFL